MAATRKRKWSEGLRLSASSGKYPKNPKHTHACSEGEAENQEPGVDLAPSDVCLFRMLLSQTADPGLQQLILPTDRLVFILFPLP